jgi:hypothetical protein
MRSNRNSGLGNGLTLDNLPFPNDHLGLGHSGLPKNPGGLIIGGFHHHKLLVDFLAGRLSPRAEPTRAPILADTSTNRVKICSRSTQIAEKPRIKKLNPHFLRLNLYKFGLSIKNFAVQGDLNRRLNNFVHKQLT